MNIVKNSSGSEANKGKTHVPRELFLEEDHVTCLVKFGFHTIACCQTEKLGEIIYNFMNLFLTLLL